jgi:hypothetical protein
VGGDHAGGLALAILIAMVLIVLGAVALFFLVARRLTRNLAPPRRNLVVGLMVLVGAGAGWMVMMATFFEESFSPPPLLRLAIAPGFDAPAAIILEDPRASRTMETRGGWLPFSATTADVDVPPSGIVRVRSFGAMGGHANLDTVWSDGMTSFGAWSGPGPPGTGATAYMVIERHDSPAGGDLQMAEPPALAAYVAQREGRR